MNISRPMNIKLQFQLFHFSPNTSWAAWGLSSSRHKHVRNYSGGTLFVSLHFRIDIFFFFQLIPIRCLLSILLFFLLLQMSDAVKNGFSSKPKNEKKKKYISTEGPHCVWQRQCHCAKAGTRCVAIADQDCVVKI